MLEVIESIVKVTLAVEAQALVVRRHVVISHGVPANRVVLQRERVFSNSC